MEVLPKNEMEQKQGNYSIFGPMIAKKNCSSERMWDYNELGYSRNSSTTTINTFLYVPNNTHKVRNVPNLGRHTGSGLWANTMGVGIHYLCVITQLWTEKQ